MTTSPENLVTLKKVTLRYSKVEDRIRMNALVASGSVICFWLTQRLCRELVKSLVTHFNESGFRYGDASPQNQRALQGYLHEAAKTNKKKAVPVPDRVAASQVLLDRVRLRASRDLIQFVFPLPDKSRAILVLRPNEARQWLEILYQQYRLAEWPLGVWPEWIRAASASDSSQAAPAQGRVH